MSLLSAFAIDVKMKTVLFPDGNLPVYVVDNEIYRYLPSVVIGTIDKLASIGNQRKLSMLFGKVTGRCTDTRVL